MSRCILPGAVVLVLLNDPSLASYLAILVGAIVVAPALLCVLVILVRRDDGPEVLQALAEVVRALRGR